MMYFANSQILAFRTVADTVARRSGSVAAAVLVGLSFSTAHAQTLIEEVELPKPVVLQSGVPIPELEDAARQAIVTDDAAQSDRQHDLGVREYELGTSTIREYRTGEQLLYVEVISETGSTYVVEHNLRQKSETRKPRSGVVVSTW